MINPDEDCIFTKDFKEFKEIIQEWFDSECMEIDESCQMAQGPIEELLDEVDPHTSYPEELEAIKEKNKRISLIVCNDELEGFVRTKKAFPDMEGKDGVHMEELFIHPDYRGSGVGKWAVEKVFDDNPDAEFIGGMSLAQSFGFWEKLGATLSPIVMMGKRGLYLRKEDFRR